VLLRLQGVRKISLLQGFISTASQLGKSDKVGSSKHRLTAGFLEANYDLLEMSLRGQVEKKLK